jgi:hypothetical protein
MSQPISLSNLILRDPTYFPALHSFVPSFLPYHGPWRYVSGSTFFAVFLTASPGIMYYNSRKRLMADGDLYDPNLTKAEADPKYGDIAEYPVGSTFKSR